MYGRREDIKQQEGFSFEHVFTTDRTDNIFMRDYYLL